MARLVRLSAPDVPQLIMQRGRAGQVIAGDAEAFDTLQKILSEAVRSYGVALHAFVLMPDHFRLLATTPTVAVLSRLLQSLGRRYVQYFNRRFGRHGSLWDQRYRSALLQPEQHLLSAMRFVEQAPVLEGLAADAAHYPWSSYRHHSGFEPCAFLTDHPIYWALGNTPFERQAVYKELSEQPLGDQESVALSRAVQGGWALGEPEFLQRLALTAQRRTQPLSRGRPSKKVQTEA